MEILKYQLFDKITQSIIKEYPSNEGKKARNRADKLDLNYGAIRYSVKPIFG